MKIGLFFLLLGTILSIQAVAVRGPWWLLLWPAMSCAVVAAGYLRFGYRVLGKRADGTIAWPAIVVLLPYLLLSWLIWCFLRLTSREPVFQELVPGVLIGRRPLPAEVPVNVGWIVDLAAEFPERSRVRRGRKYLSVPMLDRYVGDADAFVVAARDIAAANGTTYIHCAQGHGRTGTMAVAVLIAKGLCRSVDEALAKVQFARPGVRLSREQRQFVRSICGRLLENDRIEPR